MIPGIDGVGRRADGKLFSFVADDDAIGRLAEQAVVDVRRSIELPDGADLIRVAAAMNPAMASWVALRCRATSRRSGEPEVPGVRTVIIPSFDRGRIDRRAPEPTAPEPTLTGEEDAC